MNTLDERIRGALHERATGDVDVESLLDGARRRGLRHRGTRRAAGAVVAVGTVAVIIAGTVIALSPTRRSRGAVVAPTHGASTSPAPGDQLRPPDAPGATPATADPKVIASDPTLFHLDVDLSAAGLPAPVTRLHWNSQTGSESLSLGLGSGSLSGYPQITASLDRHAFDRPPGLPTRPVKVNGAPATLWEEDGLHLTTVLWQPLPGVWAAVTGLGDEPTIRVAEAVRFDHVMRCALPFTLTTTTPGAWMDSCTVAIDAAGVTAEVEVRTAKGWGVVVLSQPKAHAPRVDATTTINGHPASIRKPDAGSNFPVGNIRIDYGDRVVELIGYVVHGTSLLQVAEGFRPVPGDDPTRWPANPLP